MKKRVATVAVSLVVALASVNSLLAQGTAFTYQGLLTENGNLANGNYDLRFRLFNALTDGSQLSSTVTRAPVAVSNGLCTVTLDFGSAAFDGSGRWLEIAVRTNGSAVAHTPLSPRQAVLPGPYAIQAAFAGGLTGNPIVTGTVTFSPSSGAPFVVGSAAKVNNLNADLLDGLDSSAFAPAWHPPNDCPEGCYWKLLGNTGTSAGVNFLGTTDNQPLELKVNGQRALRLEPTTGSPNLVGGSQQNAVGDFNQGVTIAGGGDSLAPNTVSPGFPESATYATISGGAGHTIGGAKYSTIGGGDSNHISGFQFFHGWATIGGGRHNRVLSTGGSTIGGGESNLVSGVCGYLTIGGGFNNVVSGSLGTIGGGGENVISGGCPGGAPSPYSTIGGGFRNIISFAGGGSTIAGGVNNLVGPGFEVTHAAIGGGDTNVVSGSFGTIPGGERNLATNYAFAAGRRAKATREGSFVWADSTDADITSSAADQFTARASGGTRFFSNSGATVGVQLAAGGNAWSPLSDRNAKENFEALDCREVLSKLEEMPVTTWNLKSQPASIRHIGPMAQDFKATFGVGEDDRHISTSDADGVAFAAIKGLNALLKEKDARIAALEKKAAQLEALEANVVELRRLVNTLVQSSNGGAQ